MKVLRPAHYVFTCLLFVFGTSLCGAEAADFLPEGTCCPSSQKEAPKSSTPETVCCELGQVRFVSLENKIEVTEEFAQTKYKKSLNLNRPLIASVGTALRKTPPADSYPDHSFESSFLKHSLNPRAPCQA